ncbi:uncharacterized protein TNCV_5074941 [Trichonephila clavipes]|nr:uncharacterized protein TNCV_5074941 [Trichonephila clavipes]
MRSMSINSRHGWSKCIIWRGERIGMASENMMTRYDARATGHDFHEVDKCGYGIRNVAKYSQEVQTNWEGPYTSPKSLNDNVLRIQKSPHSKKPKVIHYNRLAPYLDQDE